MRLYKDHPFDFAKWSFVLTLCFSTYQKIICDEENLPYAYVFGRGGLFNRV